ncbi:M48 family metalloprotease [Streptomyces sp. NPDC057253]|uniref:M48 family metalloprotease n=1 Tax=Streptomyces sp. NPDC057253 TaxID=3346069 RepID=UPI00363BB72F
MELVVVGVVVLMACAVPGSPGRVVVSRGILRSLTDREREAPLAHERGHLRCRDHLFRIPWRLTAALNPLLRPLGVAGGFVLERWADEEAAQRVGDRKVVAQAVGRAASASAGASSAYAATASAPSAGEHRHEPDFCFGDQDRRELQEHRPQRGGRNLSATRVLCERSAWRLGGAASVGGSTRGSLIRRLRWPRTAAARPTSWAPASPSAASPAPTGSPTTWTPKHRQAPSNSDMLPVAPAACR